MRKIPQSRPPGLRSWSTLHLKTVSDLAGIVLAMMKPILTNMKEAGQTWATKFKKWCSAKIISNGLSHVKSTVCDIKTTVMSLHYSGVEVKITLMISSLHIILIY